MAKEEQPKPFPTTENKESRLCPVQTIAGFGETTGIHPRRSTIETSAQACSETTLWRGSNLRWQFRWYTFFSLNNPRDLIV